MAGDIPNIVSKVVQALLPQLDVEVPDIQSNRIIVISL